MDRALWFLLWLRLYGWLRRLAVSLRRPKGLALAVVTLAVFIPWLLSGRLFVSPEGTDLPTLRRFGPLWLLGYSALTLLFSSGERAIAFNPAEVSMLFAAPFPRRQLVLYKIIVSVSNSLIAAAVMSVIAGGQAPTALGCFLGIWVALVFLQFVSMIVGLVLALREELPLAWQRGVTVVSVVTALLLVAAVVVSGGADDGAAHGFIHRLETSPVVRAAVIPFGWFIQVFTAEHLWPDLAAGLAKSLALELVMVLIVFALDVKYLEVAAAVSERVYKRLEEMRSGRSVPFPFRTSETVGWTVPALPWLGGAGPIAWRQGLTAARSLGRLLPILLIYLSLLIPLFSPEWRDDPGRFAFLLGVIVVGFSVFLTPLTPFDFRGDIDRMDELKALPLPAWRLVTGQLVVPTLILSGAQILTLIAIQLLLRSVRPEVCVLAAFTLPNNLLLFAIENGLFLMFPMRLFAAPGDLQGMGRQILRWMAVTTGSVLSLVVSVTAGLITFFVTGQNVPLALAAAWLTMTAVGVSLIPLLGIAFDRFDVSRDVPV